MDVTDIAISKKYTAKTAQGMGALKGDKGDKGDQGVGITSISKTGSIDNKDTYTITFSDNTSTTFEVTNGADGKNIGMSVLENTGRSYKVEFVKPDGTVVESPNLKGTSVELEIAEDTADSYKLKFILHDEATTTEIESPNLKGISQKWHFGVAISGEAISQVVTIPNTNTGDCYFNTTSKQIYKREDITTTDEWYYIGTLEGKEGKDIYEWAVAEGLFVGTKLEFYESLVNEATPVEIVKDKPDLMSDTTELGTWYYYKTSNPNQPIPQLPTDNAWVSLISVDWTQTYLAGNYSFYDGIRYVNVTTAHDYIPLGDDYEIYLLFDERSMQAANYIYQKSTGAVNIIGWTPCTETETLPSGYTLVLATKNGCGIWKQTIYIGASKALAYEVTLSTGTDVTGLLKVLEFNNVVGTDTLVTQATQLKSAINELAAHIFGHNNLSTLNTNSQNIIGAINELLGNVDDVLDENSENPVKNKTITLKIQEMEQNFQNGVEGIYNACVEVGSTPDDKTPTSIIEAIKKLKKDEKWRLWVQAGGIYDEVFTSIDDVLADSATLDTLMKKHASVDFLVNWLESDITALATITSDEPSMQYIGTYDYCADKMLASNVIKPKLLASNYWQYILKDHIPVMTSNTTPSGVASESSSYTSTSTNVNLRAWYAFDGGVNDNIPGVGWAAIASDTTPRISYHFTKPINIKKIWLKNSDNNAVKTFELYGSNDNINWTKIGGTFTSTNTSASGESYYDVDCEQYYVKYYLQVLSDTNEYSSCGARIRGLNFFGRSLNVSVPTMTSDTAPEGECRASSCYNVDSQRYAFWAFNGDTEMNKSGWLTNTGKTAPQWIQYKFSKAVTIKCVMLRNRNITSNNNPKTFTIQGSNDGVAFDTLGTFTNTSNNVGATSYYNIANKKSYSYWRMYITATQANGTQVGLGKLQFYGVDYSE